MLLPAAARASAVGIREFPCRAWGRGDIRGGEAGGVDDLDVRGDFVEYGMGFWGDGWDGGYAGGGEVDGWCLNWWESEGLD